MKTVLQEHSLNWALTHLSRFCDNDFFPAMFEVSVFADDWDEVRMHVLAVDLNSHVPRPPLVRFAPKLAGSFRILHRLDPIDSLIYTALVHEIHETLSESHGPGSAASMHPFRIEPSADGSFFAGRNSWQQHTEKLETLANKYRPAGPQETGGWVFMADIHDFFGNIQPRRLVQVLLESRAVGADRAQALGRFLSAVCTGAGRGLPAGPGASRVLAELVLADIDQKILKHTADFTRWGDDLRMFFRTRGEADAALRELTAHLHATHELGFAPQKTRILPVDEFLARHFKRLPDESMDAGAAEIRLSQFVGQNPHALHYHWMSAETAAPESASVRIMLQSLPEHLEVGKAYVVHFNRAVEGNPPDLFAVKRILRKASAYRIQTLLPGVLAHFDKLDPVIRETAIYLKSVLDKDNVRTYAREIRKAWEKRVHSSSYFNEWMGYVLINPAFNEVDLPAHYSELVDVRSKALIALRKKDVDWVRRHAAQLDVFDLWDRRAVLFACSILPEGERAEVARKVLARGGITERAVARHIEPGALAAAAAARAGQERGIRSPDNYPSYGYKAFRGPDSETVRRDQVQAPDNYPAYGNKAVAPSPQWLNERVPELDALLREHGSGITVSVQDSIDSGNCMSGTEAFRQEVLAHLRLVSDTAVVPASALLAFRDDPLTRRAARAAALRWKELQSRKT